MSTSTPGRHRESDAVSPATKTSDQHNTLSAEEHAFDAIAKETELRLRQQREQNREARQFRHEHLEQNAPDDDGRDSPTIQLSPMGSTRSRMNGTTTNSLLLQKFLNGDIDLRSVEQRDLRRLLSELESKYKSSMITNSSIYNEKQALHYQVDSFKDLLDEHYETLNQAKRQFQEKSRDFELQKRTLTDFQEECNQLKELLASREKLIEESGMQLYNHEEQPTSLISPETLVLLNSLGEGSIDEKLKRILNEKSEQVEQIVKLKSDLDNEKNRLRILEKQKLNSIDLYNQNNNGVYDFQQQKLATRELTDLKNHLQRFEMDNKSLQQENKRCEVHLTTYKQQLQDAERAEEELKQERRRLQRELRIARDEFENERTRNDILQRENERLRVIRKKNLLNNTDENLVLSRSNSPLLPTNSNDMQSNST